MLPDVENLIAMQHIQSELTRLDVLVILVYCFLTWLNSMEKWVLSYVKSYLDSLITLPERGGGHQRRQFKSFILGDHFSDIYFIIRPDTSSNLDLCTILSFQGYQIWLSLLGCHIHLLLRNKSEKGLYLELAGSRTGIRSLEETFQVKRNWSEQGKCSKQEKLHLHDVNWVPGKAAPTSLKQVWMALISRYFALVSHLPQFHSPFALELLLKLRSIIPKRPVQKVHWEWVL